MATTERKANDETFEYRSRLAAIVRDRGDANSAIALTLGLELLSIAKRGPDADEVELIRALWEVRTGLGGRTKQKHEATIADRVVASLNWYALGEGYGLGALAAARVAAGARAKPLDETVDIVIADLAGWLQHDPARLKIIEGKVLRTHIAAAVRCLRKQDGWRKAIGEVWSDLGVQRSWAQYAATKRKRRSVKNRNA